MALGKLIDGKWTTEWTEHNAQGQFQRMPTVFHNKITRDGASGFKAEEGRYHLYISLGCPWAHRTALLWKLKGLENAIGLSIVAHPGGSLPSVKRISIGASWHVTLAIVVVFANADTCATSSYL